MVVKIKRRRNRKRDLIFLLKSSSFLANYLFAIATDASCRCFKIYISEAVPVSSLVKTLLYSSTQLMGVQMVYSFWRTVWQYGSKGFKKSYTFFDFKLYF